jgi:hypothetical protein
MERTIVELLTVTVPYDVALVAGISLNPFRDTAKPTKVYRRTAHNHGEKKARDFETLV